MKAVFLVLLLVPCAAALNRYWVGSNTDFANALNWDSWDPTDSAAAAPSWLEVGGDVPITSLVNAAVYNVGSRVKFAEDFKFRLSDGAKFVFDESAKTDTTRTKATFTAGYDTDAQGFDLNCHLNWANDQELLNVGNKLCDVDVGIFLAGHSYFVKSNNDLPNWNVQKLVLRDQDITTCDAAPDEFQLNCGVAGFNDQAYCQSIGYFVSPSCLCFSSCPTPQMKLEQDKAIRDALKEFNDDAVADGETVVTKAFDAKFDLSTLMLTRQQMEDILNDNAKKADLIEKVQAALARAWGVENDAVTISTIDLDSAGLRLVVTGSITASKRSLLGPGESLDNFDPNTPFSADVSGVWSDEDTSKLAQALRESVVSSVVEETKRALTEEQAAAVAACGTTCSALGDDFNALLEDLGTLFSDPQDVMGRIRTACNGASDVAACIKGEVSAADAKKGVTQADLDDFADDYADLLGRAADKTAFQTAVDAVAAVLTKLNEQDELAAGLPTLAVVSSPPVRFALQRSATDIAIMANSINRLPLSMQLWRALTGVGDILAYDSNFELRAVLPTGRRALDDSYLEAQFDYQTLCPPGTVADNSCAFGASSQTAQDIAALFNLISGAYELDGHHQCYTPGVGYDEGCLQNVANTAYQNAIDAGLTPDQARLAAINAYRMAALCDETGVNPDTGACYNERDQDQVTANANSAADVAASSATLPSTSKSGAGGLPIIAGAAVGGLLVIALIVFLVVRSRGGSSSRGGGASGEDRNVVAFENPMYDDPSQAQVAEAPTYDSAGHEGLYDEPAFTGVGDDKTNPLYESTEDLAGFGGEGDDDGGYLDVAPEN